MSELREEAINLINKMPEDYLFAIVKDIRLFLEDKDYAEAGVKLAKFRDGQAEYEDDVIKRLYDLLNFLLTEDSERVIPMLLDIMAKYENYAEARRKLLKFQNELCEYKEHGDEIDHELSKVLEYWVKKDPDRVCAIALDIVVRGEPNQ